MRNLLFAIMLIPFLACGQSKESFRVKLIDYSEDKIPAYCGYIAFATTLKFELCEDFDTLKKGQQILVIIACPREIGIENYVNGQEYDLITYGNNPEDQKHTKYGWSIWYQYENEKLPKFWSKQLTPRK